MVYLNLLSTVSFDRHTSKKKKMADDKVVEDETPEQPTTAAETEEAPATELAAKDPVEPAAEDTYESVSAPEAKETEEEAATATATEPEKTNGNVESAAAETIEVPLDENEAAAQPLTGEKDVESGPSNEVPKEKSTARIQERLIRTLRKREILFPLIGGVTFLIGLILIITGLLVMQNRCDSAVLVSPHVHVIQFGKKWKIEILKTSDSVTFFSSSLSYIGNVMAYFILFNHKRNI